MSGPAAVPDPFSLEGFQAQPRLGGLVVTPDGSRAVVGVSAPDADGTRFTGALWAVDTTGETPARRLTRSSKGESSPRFTPGGDLLFLSGRPVPGEDSDHDPTGLWLLPGAGGEARPVVTRPGGVSGLAVARGSGTVVVVAPTLPGSADEQADAEAVTTRRDDKVRAILHESTPVRFWDHDLGAASHRLYVAVPPEQDDPDTGWTLRDLTGHVGHALDHAAPDLTPDGSTVVTAWEVAEAGGDVRSTVVAVDVATGAVRTLADDDDHLFGDPRVSPDGRTVAMVREGRTTPTTPPTVQVVTVPLAGGPVQVLTAAGWDGWPHALRWTPEGDALVVQADHHGRGPLFRVPVGDTPAGEPERLTADHGAYPDFEPLPGGAVVALRNAYDAPPAPVLVGADGTVRDLPGPAAAVTVPGRLEEVTATAADGTPLRAWLALPTGASAADPAPLVLWVHGGPLSSWNAWSWRWNPWLLTVHGYAVLLPDPALSTGYGPEMIRRGWGAWGAAPYTDSLTVTDAAVEHEAVDGTRTAMMGGSFGGYMANWIAGHTDRFAAIVSHASLWNLDTFGDTTDAPWYWRRELTPEAAATYSPHRFAAEIVTPMLVVHGDKDYRVPIGEGLALWWALNARSPRAEAPEPAEGVADDAPAPVAHKFLYYPDENHWVLTPHHAEVWYETVVAFLDLHVLGRDWTRPPRLG